MQPSLDYFLTTFLMDSTVLMKSLHLKPYFQVLSLLKDMLLLGLVVVVFVSVKAEVHLSDLLKGNHNCLHLKVKDQPSFVNSGNIS